MITLKSILKKWSLNFYIISAIIYLISYAFHQEIITTIFKPLPVLILIVIIDKSYRYNLFIYFAFMFSMIGDILLMKTVNLFLFGLFAFLIAQIFYISAFLFKSKKTGLFSSLPFIVYNIIIFISLKPYLKEMIIPVAIYMMVITIMVWRSFVQRGVDEKARFACIGAIFFVISDSILAISYFKGSFFPDWFMIMSTYWIAQYFIFLSTRYSN